MTWTPEAIPDLSGKTVLITGANSGIGFQAARLLAAKRARVLIACRDPQRSQQALTDLKAQVPGADVVLHSLDLADLASVRKLAAELTASEQRLDILINNAGVMAPPLMRTKDGFEMQFGTNHLGHFALTGLLLPLLNAAPAPRVVTVSSIAIYIGKIHFDDINWQNRYSPWLAYGQSKLANLMFALELQRRAATLGGKISAFAVHPGYSATNLQDDMFGGKIFNALFAQSPEMGSYPTVFAATAPAARPGGYYGPRFGVWGGPGKSPSRPLAHDASIAGELWQLSEKLTGVVYARQLPTPAQAA